MFTLQQLLYSCNLAVNIISLLICLFSFCFIRALEHSFFDCLLSICYFQNKSTLGSPTRIHFIFSFIILFLYIFRSLIFSPSISFYRLTICFFSVWFPFLFFLFVYFFFIGLCMRLWFYIHCQMLLCAIICARDSARNGIVMPFV